MGYFDDTLATIASHKERMQNASAEEAITAFEELKALQRNICRNPHTRQSILHVRVNSALNAARNRIAITKTVLSQDFVKSNPALETYFHTHHWLCAGVLTVFYLFVLLLQMRVSHRG